MASIINISTYRFTPFTDLKPVREDLLTRCVAWGLKGTILLSTEGINLFVAGPEGPMQEFIAHLRTLPGLEDLPVKISLSEEQPFRRMLVRIKKEIIAFGVEGVDPAVRTSPKLPAATLKQWLDEGRPVTLLDTRNDYEVKLGTFRNAVPAGINQFRDFPAAVRRLPEELKRQPIVMFCTGGIRCEKAGPFMEMEGFEQIYQLDGGILKYFEEVGGAHYDGECFVFDQRVGVDAALEETESTQCYACQTPLTRADQQSPLYFPGKQCPSCYVPPAEETARRMVARQQALDAAASPLPGSLPYDNYRPLRVTGQFDGATVMEFLTGALGHHSQEVWEEVCSSGRLLDADHQPLKATDRLIAGSRIIHLVPAMREPDVNASVRLLHEDEALIVLNKPAPLPIHAGGNFNRNSLQYILRAAWSPESPRSAHRLDANTTGVMVWTRSQHFASAVSQQFARGEVEKSYLVKVHGNPADDTFSCDAAISASSVAAGARELEEGGLSALTHFEVIERCADGTALLVARPVTGRTNQIRIHARAMGHPVCGDPVYTQAEALGTVPTLAPTDPPLCLHAWRITLTHPITRKRVTYEAPPPAWAGDGENLPCIRQEKDLEIPAGQHCVCA